MNLQTHQFVIEQALDFLGNEELKSYTKVIRRGVKRPDQVRILASPHFYHPFKKRNRVFSNAKDKGIKYFNKAVKYHQKNKNKKCFFALGKSLHYLADLAVPAHTHLINHFWNTDGLENYLGKNFNRVKFSVKLEEKNLAAYFEELAKISFSLECFPNSSFRKLNIFRKEKKLSLQELEKQAGITLSSAINYSVGLLNLFVKEKNIKIDR